MRKNNNELVWHIYANSALIIFAVAVMATGYIVEYNMMVTVGSLLAGYGVYKVYNYYHLWKQ